MAVMTALTPKASGSCIGSQSAPNRRVALVPYVVTAALMAATLAAGVRAVCLWVR